MNFDRTFCTGLRCGKANTCDRWIEHLHEWAKKNKRDLSHKPISVAQFADHAGTCSMYSPIEGPTDA